MPSLADFSSYFYPSLGAKVGYDPTNFVGFMVGSSSNSAKGSSSSAFLRLLLDGILASGSYIRELAAG